MTKLNDTDMPRVSQDGQTSDVRETWEKPVLRRLQASMAEYKHQSKKKFDGFNNYS